NTWVHGWIQLVEDLPDCTNTLLLTGSMLAANLGQSIGVWRCPSDHSRSRQWGAPRVRTVSMNCWLNADQPWDYFVGSSPPKSSRIFKKTTDMVDPGPSRTFVFTDERADSINDGYFALAMGLQGKIAILPDGPGSYHNRAGTFSFADGHAELHKWKDPRTMLP